MTFYIPIRGPEIPELLNEYNRFLADFTNFTSTNEIKGLLGFDTTKPYINKIGFHVIYSSKRTGEEDAEIKDIAEKYIFFRTGNASEFLKVNLDFTYKYDENQKDFSIILDFIIYKLSLIVNLTYAAKVDFLDGILFSNTQQFQGRSALLLSNLDYSYEHAQKIGWPQIDGLTLLETVSWYNSNKLHTDQNSKTKLHRAINAFSYQFSHLLEKDTSVLFWTMLGIEALLAEGNSNIIQQIKIKSALLLGQPQEYKKKLDKLYNYRSRFVHGDINFPPKFSSDYENFEEEYWDYLHFATSILISLIRLLIKKDNHEFSFEYQLIE